MSKSNPNVRVIRNPLGNGEYDVRINRELVGRVVKAERRNHVLTQDAGRTYSIGTVRDPFCWHSLDDRGRKIRSFRRRQDAVDAIIRAATS